MFTMSLAYKSAFFSWRSFMIPSLPLLAAICSAVSLFYQKQILQNNHSIIFIWPPWLIYLISFVKVDVSDAQQSIQVIYVTIFSSTQ